MRCRKKLYDALSVRTYPCAPRLKRPPGFFLGFVSAGRPPNPGGELVLIIWVVCRDPAPVTLPVKRVVAYLAKRDAHAQTRGVVASGHEAVNLKGFAVPLLVRPSVDSANDATVPVSLADALLDVQNLSWSLPTH
jgi:hypothetical protein